MNGADGIPGDDVGSFLEAADLHIAVLEFAGLRNQVLKGFGCRDDVLGMLAEPLGEFRIAGHQGSEEAEQHVRMPMKSSLGPAAFRYGRRARPLLRNIAGPASAVPQLLPHGTGLG